MGGASDQTYQENRNFNNTILQASTQTCELICTTEFNNNVLIAINYTGSINITQSCVISNSTCKLKAAFDANIENIIETTVEQSADAMGGLSFTFNLQNEAIDISSVVDNSISQIMTSSCRIESSLEKNNNYFLLVNSSGGIDLGQEGEINSSNCSLDNYAKAATFNTALASATQKTSLQNIFTFIFIAFIVIILVVGVVLLAFVLTGGAAKAIGSKKGKQPAPAPKKS